MNVKDSGIIIIIIIIDRCWNQIASLKVYDWVPHKSNSVH